MDSGRRPPTQPALGLGKKLAAPPPVTLIQQLLKSVEAIDGVPQPPAPRRAPGDRSLFNTQRKVGAALVKIVVLAEKDPGNEFSTELRSLAALVRSVYEDINEQRRRLLVGRQGAVLDPRADMTEPRLLKPHEEQKLRTTPLGKGKGKGKGKGRGNYRPNPNYNYNTVSSSSGAYVKDGGQHDSRRGRPFRSRSGPPKDK